MFDILISLIALSGATQANAQAPAPASPAPPQVWDLEYEEPHCTLTTASADKSALTLSMTPGDPDPALDLVPAGKPVWIIPMQRATVTLQPSGRTFEAHLGVAGNQKKSALRFTYLGDRFAAEFSQSSSVQFKIDKRAFSMPLKGSGEAMSALHQCMDKKLAEWGIDPKAYDALRRPPLDIDGYNWMRDSDYPADAVQQNRSGDVVARLSVDASGKVTDCKLIIGAEMRSVDDVVCRSALKRGRYYPAIGADGRPTAAARVETIGFRIMN